MPPNVHFSSKTYEWSTPQAYFDLVEAEFGFFDLDPCATADNTKGRAWWTKEQDGLGKPWYGRVWMNPPYGYGIKDWVRKAYTSSLRGCLCVCLLPARTDASWWHDYVMKGEVRFIRGRLKFGGSKTNAPFPSALVIFRPQVDLIG